MDWCNNEHTSSIPVGQMELDAQRSAQVARQQLAGDVQAIETYNAPILEANRRVRRGPLRAPSGPTRATTARPGRSGWSISSDMRSQPRRPPLRDHRHRASPADLPAPGPSRSSQQTLTAQPYVAHHSCFGAGTPVRTLDGLRPIESLRVGDQVLTQDPTSGELKYQAVVAVYHNPPNATVRIAMEGGESIVATGIHRLWKAGKGWTMARELKPGDVLRTLGGLASVKSVEADRTQLVYNLQVADGESYFVGKSGVLAHDNSTINPVPEPFDAVGPLSDDAGRGEAQIHARPMKAGPRPGGVESMLSIVLVCFGLVADDGAKPPAKAPPDRAAYEAAASKAGHDAGAHVRLALWCEQHGMTAERMKHLAAAVVQDPSNALARAAGARRLQRQVGAARPGQPRGQGRPRAQGADAGVPRAPAPGRPRPPTPSSSWPPGAIRMA